jgi:hypothetical protein
MTFAPAVVPIEQMIAAEGFVMMLKITRGHAFQRDLCQR